MIDPAAPTRVEQFQRGGALERTAANEQVEAAAAAETIFKARMSDSLMDPFHVLKRTRKLTKLEPWIYAAKEGNSAAFAAGTESNQAEVRATIVEPWSSGRVEGQVTRLKHFKLQLYGRSKLDSRIARSMAAARKANWSQFFALIERPRRLDVTRRQHAL